MSFELPFSTAAPLWRVFKVVGEVPFFQTFADKTPLTDHKAQHPRRQLSSYSPP
jgi:hypothetical protein